MDTEIEEGLTSEEVVEESKRCMSCGMCMDCETLLDVLHPQRFCKVAQRRTL